MQMGPDLKEDCGTILIVTLWILTILTLLAVALGQRASLEIKLMEYQRDKLKAIELARAAIARAILEKKNDPLPELDALSESWANNQPAFKDLELGGGTFTVSHCFDDAITLYGLQDEESKININQVSQPVLADLLKSYGNAEEIAASLVAWRSQAEEPAEDYYYRNLDKPYSCKNERFKSIAELLLVRGMNPEILYGIDEDNNGRISENEQGLARYITIYGRGKVNINTAPRKVLQALLGNVLAGKVVRYRQGADREISTDDDGWFSDSSTPVDVPFGYGQVINLDLALTAEPFTQSEWNKLRNLKTNSLLSVSSHTYTIYAQAEVRKVKKYITATVDLSAEQVKYLNWQRN